MLSELLKSVKDVGVYPMISLLMFFIFFIAMFTWVIRSSKKEFEEISRIPLYDANDSEAKRNQINIKY